ncbi:MAG: hypothetical protein R3242_02060 [Akkermansiaceae bacterium]|nr:hypothetical protein [Akkermansiaceae bacterium]
MRDRILEQMKGRAAPDALLDPEGGELDIEQNAIIRLKDGNGSIEFSTKNGETQLTARDKDNEIEWQGPWNNEEDKAKAPEDIRERAKKLKAGGAHGIHLKFNHGGALVPPRE